MIVTGNTFQKEIAAFRLNISYKFTSNSVREYLAC